ncbi:hypothetical protein [Methanobrevibacter sp.]
MNINLATGVAAPKSLDDYHGKNIQQQLSMFTADPGVQNMAGHIGSTLGSIAIPIPIVGSTIGRAVGEKVMNNISYQLGLGGEIQQSIQDILAGANVGNEIMDVVSYIPRRMITDFNNNPLVKIIKGEVHPFDAGMQYLEDLSFVKYLAPDKTYAWKDKQGNYHKTYVDGAKPVVGTWHESTPQLRPDPSSNNIRITSSGEVIRNGF